MTTLGFDNYVEPLKDYLQKYRDVRKLMLFVTMSICVRCTFQSSYILQRWCRNSRVLLFICFDTICSLWAFSSSLSGQQRRQQNSRRDISQWLGWIIQWVVAAFDVRLFLVSSVFMISVFTVIIDLAPGVLNADPNQQNIIYTTYSAAATAPQQVGSNRSLTENLNLVYIIELFKLLFFLCLKDEQQQIAWTIHVIEGINHISFVLYTNFFSQSVAFLFALFMLSNHFKFFKTLWYHICWSVMIRHIHHSTDRKILIVIFLVPHYSFLFCYRYHKQTSSNNSSMLLYLWTVAKREGIVFIMCVDGYCVQVLFINLAKWILVIYISVALHWEQSLEFACLAVLMGELRYTFIRAVRSLCNSEIIVQTLILFMDGYRFFSRVCECICSELTLINV